jgi:hypothetical protein
MNSEALAKLETIARNLPCKSIRMERTDWQHGEIYLAYGQDGTGRFHGVWGCRDWARTMEFTEATTQDQARQRLVDEAAEFIALSVEKGLVNGSG